MNSSAKERQEDENSNNIANNSLNKSKSTLEDKIRERHSMGILYPTAKMS